MKKWIDLSVGGADWDGWRFGPWGRAKQWRLFGPDGTFYFPSEIALLESMARDLDFYQVSMKQLEQRIRELEKPLMDAELESLQATIALLARLADGRLVKIAANVGEMVLRRRPPGAMFRLKHSDSQHPLIQKLPQDLCPQITMHMSKRANR